MPRVIESRIIKARIIESRIAGFRIVRCALAAALCALPLAARAEAPGPDWLTPAQVKQALKGAGYSEVTKLEGQVKALQKTMQNSADAVSKAQTDLNNAKASVRETEAKLTEQLYRAFSINNHGKYHK